MQHKIGHDVQSINNPDAERRGIKSSARITGMDAGKAVSMRCFMRCLYQLRTSVYAVDTEFNKGWKPLLNVAKVLTNRPPVDVLGGVRIG